MKFILDAIDSASAQGLCFPAVVTALTVPDIAGAVDAPGVGSQQRYAAWIDAWFHSRSPEYAQHGIDGIALYALRCKLLHEGLSSPADAPAAQKSIAASYKRLIAFNIGPAVSLHLCTAADTLGDSWTILRAEQFCEDMTTAARAWVASKTSDRVAMKTLRDLVDVRTSVPPLSSGVPLICAAI